MVLAMPESVDAGIAEVSDRVVPALEDMPGFAGYSMLVDRDSGRCIVTTAWHDESALAESRQRVLELRRRAADMFGDPDPEVREWEIATLHRERAVAEGAWARVTWVRVPIDRIDQQIEIFKRTVMPRLQDLPGFCSASLLVDRDEGVAAGAVVYESRAAMEAAREATMRIRSEAVSAMGAEVTEVAEFQVAHAHLRVPEHV
jgi:heme-degrading monooxygenase HmoA